MNELPTAGESAATGTEDILFECPQCGKSLEIDARGAGYIIVCPDCKTEIQVPPWSGEGEELDEVTEEERHRVELEDMLAQLQGRIEALETQRTASDLCLARIGDEIGLIQDALDRITEVVESRRAER
jgi:predicted RNA-binding Zn-ribbon protein involved in translation (DUF1610 family)